MTDQSENPTNKPPTDYEIAMREKYANQALREDELKSKENTHQTTPKGDIQSTYEDAGFLVIDVEKLDKLDFEEVKKFVNYIADKDGKEPFTDEQIREFIERSRIHNNDPFNY